MSDTVIIRARSHRRILRLIGLVVAFLLTIANGVFAIAVLDEMHSANLRVERALQAMLVLKEVENLAEGVALNQHIYRIFGDTRNLDAYHAAQRALPKELSRLPGLIAG